MIWRNRMGMWQIAIVALTAAAVATLAQADGKTRQRPLSDFLSTQGSNNQFIPPVPDYLGWTAPAPGVKTPASSYVGGNSASCDYAGLANAWLVSEGGPDLGTTVSGSVTERTLDDGNVLVKVQLHTKNALVFGMRIEFPDFGDFFTDPLIFGARAQDVLTGAVPGIGECHASFAWKQPPGALVDFTYWWAQPAPFELVSISFRASATGPLTELAGYGPTGTPGRLLISETGFNRTPGGGATVDWFPAEFVEVRAIGH
jgi:hypothetical protein